jgi:uncharacterized protein (TIGR02598 family)
MSASFPTPQPFFRERTAFSLVEVAVALAVVTFALVGILGLIPIGLGNFREAMDTTVGAQLAQRVITDAEQTDFDLLIASAESNDASFFALPVRYFDEQGTEVLPSEPHAAAKVIYHVRVRGSQPGPADPSAMGGSFTSLPGAPRFRPRDSTFLTVQVAWHPGLSALPVEDGLELWKRHAAPTSTYRAVITRNGFTTRSTAITSR